MSHNFETILADKRKHLAEIASLKKQIAGEQTFSAELEEEHKKVTFHAHVGLLPKTGLFQK